MKLGIALSEPVGLRLENRARKQRLEPHFCYAVGSEIGPEQRAVLGSELGAVLVSRIRMAATGCSA
jgi:hypothetical protein